MASFTDYKIKISDTANYIGNLRYPPQEDIGQCSPGATFATYKMAGSTGIYGKENQDSCSVVSIKWNGITYALCTMCDGHGIYGKKYSETVTTILPQLIIKQFEEILENPNIILKEIFEIVNYNLKVLYNNSHGGTTVTISIFTDGCLIIANVGDCEALLKTNSLCEEVVFERNGKIDTTFVLSESGVIRTTVDHNCNNLEEVKRVLNIGAQILYGTDSNNIQQNVFSSIIENGNAKLIQNPHINQIGGYLCNVSGDPAIYFSDNNIILNMTRSLGDRSGIFISGIPDVAKITWPKEKQARLLVATDGYFNCINKSKHDDELSFDLSPIDICTRAYNAVGNTFGYDNADNTTIVIFDIGI